MRILATRIPAGTGICLLGAKPAQERRLMELGASWVRRLGLGELPADLPEAEAFAFVCWPTWPNPDLNESLTELSQRFPGIPLLVRVDRNGAEAVEALARGFTETFRGLGDLGQALARAFARKGAQAQGGRPEERFEGLFPNLYDWIYVVGIDESGEFRFESVNPPLGAGAGFLNPDFSGRSPEVCLSAPVAQQMLLHLKQAIQADRPLFFEEEHAIEGKPRSFRTLLTPIHNKWGRIHRIAGVSRDITALREAQAALQASEERLNLALEGTQQSLWDWDLTRNEVFRSPRWYQMLGLPNASLPPTTEAGLSLIHPDDRRQVEGALNAHLEGRQGRFQVEYRLRTVSGDWLWVFDAGKVVAWDGSGMPTRLAGMCTDISERRRAEESLRALVGGVVHEMRNPVYGIAINLDALEATFGLEPRFAPFLGALRESCDRISSLMSDLRDYGEPRTLNPEPCLVRSLLEDARRSCVALAESRGCDIDIHLDEPDLVIPLSTRRMHQVFRNLFENALQHAPEGTSVVVLAKLEAHPVAPWLQIRVEDRGPGFSPEALHRAFEPFFTRRKDGTGLGLSIVKRVVEEHGGTVEAANQPEGGARVSLRLPAPRMRMSREEVGHG